MFYLKYIPDCGNRAIICQILVDDAPKYTVNVHNFYNTSMPKVRKTRTLTGNHRKEKNYMVQAEYRMQRGLSVIMTDVRTCIQRTWTRTVLQSNSLHSILSCILFIRTNGVIGPRSLRELNFYDQLLNLVFFAHITSN